MSRRTDMALPTPLVAAIAGLILVLSSRAPIPSAQTAPSAPHIPQELRNRLQRDGRTRVIVELRMPAPHVAEATMRNGAAIANQRQDIATRRARLLARLPGGSHREIRRFATIPYVVLDVTQAGLGALEQLGDEVASVRPDILHKTSLAESVPLIEADQVWAAGFDGSGTMIAVLDTGVDSTHPFLAGKVVEEACYSTTQAGLSESFCPNGLNEQLGAGAAVPCPLPTCEHGTHVAGIAAGGSSDPAHPFPGVAKGAEVMAVQVFTAVIDAPSCGGAAPCVGAFTSDIIAGLERVYAVALAGDHHVAAVNMSLGADIFEAPCDDQPYKPIIDNLRAIGVATVVAAGNDGWPFGLAAPACISSVVSVGATDKQDDVAWFSNTAPFLSLFAPGDSITSSVPGGGYEPLSGTSMAAPHVAGVWALLKQAAPDATVTTILDALQFTGLPITDMRYGDLFGPGVTVPRVRAAAALAALVPVSNPMPVVASLSPGVIRAGVGGTLTVIGTGFNSSSVVEWNGVPRPTHAVSVTTLHASIAASDVSAEGSADITVFNPPPDGGRSNLMSIAIGPPPMLTISAPIVGPGFQETVTLARGYGGPDDLLALALVGAPDGSEAIATLVGAGITDRTWTVTMPGAGGTYEFRLYSDGIRAVASAPIVLDPAYRLPPTIDSILPTSAVAGTPSLTLNVNGSSFVASSIIRWNGVDRPTTFISEFRLQATIAAADIAAAGTAQVAVFTPPPGGGSSSALPFTIRTPPALTVDATTVAAGSPVTVTLTNGLGGGGDWLAFANAAAPDTSVLQYVNVGTNITTRTWTVTVPNTGSGSYEFRLFRDGGYVRMATSPRITATAPPPPTLTVSSTSVATGSPVTVTLTNGFGGGGDWLAFANATAPDNSVLQYINVGANITTRTWTVTVPTSGSGLYEFRLFRDGGYVRAATSPQITAIAAAPPVLTVNTTSVAAGSPVTVTLTNGFGGGGDWLAFANATAPDTSVLQYVNVGANITTRTWTVTVPATGSGLYEFRLFRDGGYVRAATSARITATAPAPPVLTVNTTTVGAGSPVTVTLTNGFGGASDWIAFANATAPDTSVLQYVNVGANVTTRTWTVTVPTTGSGLYEFRLFRDGGYVRVATSPRITAVAAAPPVLTVDATTVAAGSPVTVTLTNGFGGASDWIAFANATAPDTSVLQYINVGANVTTRTWTVTVPTSGSGSYEFRLFRDGGYVRAATSPRITAVAASPPVLTVSSTSVVAGSPVTVTLTNGFGGGGDWIAFANAAAPDTSVLQYVNVGANVTTRTWTVTVPASGSGLYEFRLFRDGGYVRAATSPQITAVAPPPPTLAVSSTSVAPGSPVTVTLTNGFGGGGDWMAFASTTAPNTSVLQYVNLGANVTTRTWTVTVPTTGSGSYEFRLFRDGGYVRAATSPTVTVP